MTTIDQAWDFFSSPANLPKITPPNMKFEVICDLQPKVYAGMLSIYRLRPLFGIPITWVTEITHVNEPDVFIDEQRFGPYRMWHHQHFFREVEGGVEVEDIVHYALRFGVIGRAVAAGIVRRRLASLFAFRRKALDSAFASASRDGS